MKKVIIGLLLLFGLVGPVYATSYYIDYTGGSDSNNGTSSGTAFKTCTPIEGTNLLIPGDTVNLKDGETWTGTDAHCRIASAGSVTSPITVTSYGSGADPLFDGSVAESTVPSWSGWTLYDGTHHVWVSNVVVPFEVENVIVDGTSSLARLWLLNQNISSMNTIKARFYMAGNNNLMYVRMGDDSDPNGHSLSFARYGPATLRGMVGTDDQYGKYINFSHIKVIGCLYMGVSSSGRNVTFTNVVSQFNGREGFYFIKNAVSNSTGASYNTCTSCTSSYNNGWGNTTFSGGAGQGITIESPHVDLIDTLSEYNWMAGIDWLDYNSSTNASFGRCIRCTSHDNSMRALYSDPNGFDPPGLYLDGANNIQVIDSVFYCSLITAANSNALYLVNIGTEHPSTKPAYNIDIVNNKIYNDNFVGLASTSLNCSGAGCNVNDNIRVIGNTFKSNGNTFLNIVMGALKPLGGTTKGVFVYNNIYYIPGGATNGSGGPADARYHGDHNIWFNNSGSTFISGTITLATWQAIDGRDANSLFINPQFVLTDTHDLHLKAIASGQASDSPALGIGYPNYLGSQYVWSSIGTVRTDNVVDNSSTPALGYHYLSTFVSSSFPSNQVGTDYF